MYGRLNLPVPVFVTLLVGGILILVFVPLGIVFGVIRRQYYPDARIIQEGDLAEATGITRDQGNRSEGQQSVRSCYATRRAAFFSNGYPPYAARARYLGSAS